MFFERKAGVVCSDRDAHDARLYYRGPAACPAHENGEAGHYRHLMSASVVISARGEERLRGGHPWIYRGDVADVRARAGDIVLVRGPRARALGHALYSDRSQIALRMLAYGGADGDGDVDREAAELIRQRIDAAIA